jgi:murein DD-endopeptidase MepM/ murein hydrolase activator NlpD
MFRPQLTRLQLPAVTFFADVIPFLLFLRMYIRLRLYRWFQRFEVGKDAVVDLLYKKRGKYVRPFLHFGTIGLIFFVISVGPLVFSRTDDEGNREDLRGVLTTAAYGSSFYTQQAEEVRQFRGGEIITHVVQEGETLSSIAERYSLEVTTILWENKIAEKTVIKPGTELKILPVDGVRHQVARGETIYSIGQKYGLDKAQVQVIVDYPFNEFSNDETFELATGQFLVVPDGVVQARKTEVVRPATRIVQTTPDAGSVTAVGSFVWPAAGRITQGYRFYHKALDIANSSGGPILASDGGTVIASGWDPSGYGNRVLVDHGNGYITLYGHLSVLQVVPGQTVNRGAVLGQMGSTGRSTGTHLHFEIRQGGVLHNPSQFLQ